MWVEEAGAALAERTAWARVENGFEGVAGEEERALFALFRGSEHLPLRGKLGWMTHAPV
jgi:hypothetical protein